MWNNIYKVGVFRLKLFVNETNVVLIAFEGWVESLVTLIVMKWYENDMVFVWKI